jgi:hypothetical protein
VTEDWRHGKRRAKAGLIDVTVPNAARVGDFLHGGRDNFSADRKAVPGLVASAPSVAEIPAAARAFRHRVIRYLAAEAAVRQFLDIGDGMVPPGNTHEVAQAFDPQSRIVYVESDPMVLAHARAMMWSAPGGLVHCIHGDIADGNGIISGAGPLLDSGLPVAVMLLSTLAHVPSAAIAAKAVATLMGAVPSGSYLAIYHLASDLDPSLTKALKQWNMVAPEAITLRSRAELAALASGLELVPPGVVPVNEWRPDGTDPGTAKPAPVHGLVALKP